MSSSEGAALAAAIVECSEDAIVGVAPDGRISAWNASAERLLGYPAGEALGLDVGRLMLEGREQRLAQALLDLDQGRFTEERAAA